MAKNFWFTAKKIISMLAIAFFVVGCAWFGNNSVTPGNSNQRNTPSATIDTISSQILTNMHLHAWNPQAMTKGVVTAGLYINWKMNDTAVTNVTNAGPDGNPQHDHDPQVDLFYLTGLSQYHLLHPQDHTFDADLSRTTNLVLADFQKYSLPKGWIYFYLLQDGSMLHNAALVDEAHTVANNYYIQWYDPALGFVYDRSHTPGNYSPNNTLTAGAALIDAGLRWRQPDWINAGEKTINHAISNALNSHYHLFYNVMGVSKSGQDPVLDAKAEVGPQGQIVDALVTAYTLTHQQQYLAVATHMLQSLFGSSGLWDTSRGGLFFALDMSKGWELPLTHFR